MPPQVREDIVPLKTYQPLATASAPHSAVFPKPFLSSAGPLQQVLQRHKPAAMGLCEDFVQDICTALLAPIPASVRRSSARR